MACADEPRQVFGVLSLGRGQGRRHRGDGGDPVSEDVVRHFQQEGAVDVLVRGVGRRDAVYRKKVDEKK